MSFEDFQDGRHGSHLGYWNGMIVAIQNFHVPPIPPIKFGLNLTLGLGADAISRCFQDGQVAILDNRMLEL